MLQYVYDITVKKVLPKIVKNLLNTSTIHQADTLHILRFMPTSVRGTATSTGYISAGLRCAHPFPNIPNLSTTLVGLKFYKNYGRTSIYI